MKPRSTEFYSDAYAYAVGYRDGRNYEPSNCRMYQFLLTIIKNYIGMDTSRDSEIMRDTTTTTRRQHMRQYRELNYVLCI